MTDRVDCDWRGRLEERPASPRNLAEWWYWLFHPSQRPLERGRWCYRTDCTGRERCVGWEREDGSGRAGWL